MQSADQAFPNPGSSNNPRKKLNAAFLLLPLGAVVLMLAGIWYLYSSYMFYANGVKVQATVVRLEESSSSDSGISFSPVFRYTVDGKDYEYESINASNPPTHEVGEVTTLLYDPNNPARARENSFWELWLLPVILCPVSFFMMILSVAIPLLVKRMS